VWPRTSTPHTRARRQAQVLARGTQVMSPPLPFCPKKSDRNLRCYVPGWPVYQTQTALGSASVYAAGHVTACSQGDGKFVVWSNACLDHFCNPDADLLTAAFWGGWITGRRSSIRNKVESWNVGITSCEDRLSHGFCSTGTLLSSDPGHPSSKPKAQAPAHPSPFLLKPNFGASRCVARPLSPSNAFVLLKPDIKDEA
jgi:hypothetical protein